jgi:hypothetical protein
VVTPSTSFTEENGLTPGSSLASTLSTPKQQPQVSPVSQVSRSVQLARSHRPVRLARPHRPIQLTRPVQLGN